ncbi:putative glycosyltransferase EpsJ [Bacteroidia bacterium]|nr:putative glycosyltransferase EpsJ [Bacteroidia bacterium]
MKNMKISVIIPVYNVEKYLGECLESIVNQSYKNLEIIVVDDGSPDNSGEIYNEYAAHDSRIKIIKQKNGGLSAARNTGIRAATGDWIHFIDSDDYLPNLDYYEKMIAAATDADADVACSGLYKEAKPMFSVIFKRTQVLTQMRDKFLKTRANSCLYVWRYLIKKSILDDNKITFEVGRIMEDVMFTTQILYYARVVVVVPHVLIFYRNNANSILRTKERAAVAKMRADHRHAFESAQLFMSEHRIPIELGNWFQVRVRHCRRLISTIKFKLFRIRLFLATRGTAIFGKKFYRNHHESINGRVLLGIVWKEH